MYSGPKPSKQLLPLRFCLPTRSGVKQSAQPRQVYVTWRFPKTRGTLLGVPIIRTIVYWGTLILGNYHILTGNARGVFGLVGVDFCSVDLCYVRTPTWCGPIRYEKSSRTFLGVRRVVPCRVFDSGRGWISPLNARHSSLCPGLAQGSLQPAEGWRWGPREPKTV